MTFGRNQSGLSQINVSIGTAALAISLIAMVLAGCKSQNDDSQTRDIYREDRGDATFGNSRRRPATQDEMLWTINMDGCTGHLIAPNYMMTAAHCQPTVGSRYTSGALLAKGGKHDITVSEVVENGYQDGSGLDYAIMEISWKGTRPENQKFAPSVATQKSDVTMSPSKDQGDALFTVGFPGDVAAKWGPTYSEGFAKTAGSTRLYYNVGIINGNSGGGIWRKSDKMLVSLANNGPNALGQGTWNSSSANDPSAWNYGDGMWAIYARSKTLKDIFPNGKNRFAPPSETSLGDIWAGIGQESGNVSEHFELWLSAPKSTERLVLCTAMSAADCKEGAAGYVSFTRQRSVGDQVIFKSDRAYAISANLKVVAAGRDSAGKLVASQTLVFSK